MASRSTTGTPGGSPFLTGDIPPEEISDHEGEQFSELDRLRTEAGPDSAWCVSVFRKAADGLRFNYCRRLPLVGFDLDKLPETFGGGTFLLRVINERGKMVKAFTVAFDPALWPAERPAPAAGAAPAPGGDPTLAGLIARMEDERKDRQRFMETLLTAVLTNKTSGPSIADLVDAQVKLRDLAGGNHRTEDSTVIQALRLGMEAAGLRPPQDAGDGEGGAGGDLFSKVVDKVAIPLVEAIRNGQTTRGTAPAPAGRAPALAAGNPPAPRAPVTGPVPAELEPFLFLKRYSAHLLGWAQSNFPPERVATVVYNLVPDDFFPVLEAFLVKAPPERFSILVQLDPRLQPYQTYLDAVTDALKQEMDIDSEPGDEPGGGADSAASR